MRRGQIALEYLITYGWGFLLIIVTLGMLSYAGMLSPSNFLPPRCDFGVQLACEDFKVDTGTISLQFRNNFGEDVRIIGASVFYANATIAGGAQNVAEGNLSRVLVITPASTAQLVAGERVNVPVMITFERKNAASPPQHNVTGEISVIVQ
jgi:hypothetical protein